MPEEPTEENILSLEDLLEKVENPVLSFSLQRGNGSGVIKYRGITTVKEHEAIGDKIRHFFTLREGQAPQLVGRVDQEIMNAVWISACVVEPKMTEDQALKMVDNFGPQTTTLFSEILEASGIGFSRFSKKAEEKTELEKQPFQTENDDADNKISEPSSEGV